MCLHSINTCTHLMGTPLRRRQRALKSNRYCLLVSFSGPVLVTTYEPLLLGPWLEFHTLLYLKAKPTQTPVEIVRHLHSKHAQQRRGAPTRIMSTALLMAFSSGMGRRTRSRLYSTASSSGTVWCAMSSGSSMCAAPAGDRI